MECVILVRKARLMNPLTERALSILHFNTLRYLNERGLRFANVTIFEYSIQNRATNVFEASCSCRRTPLEVVLPTS